MLTYSDNGFRIGLTCKQSLIARNCRGFLAQGLPRLLRDKEKNVKKKGIQAYSSHYSYNNSLRDSYCNIVLIYKAKPVHREPNCRRGGRRRWIYGYRPSQSNYTLSPSLKKVLPIKTAFRPKMKRKKFCFRVQLYNIYINKSAKT